jgi:hypothetical protein
MRPARVIAILFTPRNLSIAVWRGLVLRKFTGWKTCATSIPTRATAATAAAARAASAAAADRAGRAALIATERGDARNLARGVIVVALWTFRRVVNQTHRAANFKFGFAV